jgi:tetratricopeptide (TPR) repeat protein
MSFSRGDASVFRSRPAALGSRKLRYVLLVSALLPSFVLSSRLSSHGQSDSDELKVHYEAAGRYADAGEREHAVAEYRAFLAEALHRIANGEAVAGNFDDAVQLFDQAALFAPQDKNLWSDYARVSLDGEKLTQARAAAEKAVSLDPRDSQALFLLGSVSFHLEDYAHARAQLEAAVAGNPDFKTGYLLGRTYLILHDERQARTLFDEMIAGMGDTALIHIYFGRAYSLMDYPDQAVEEFHKAIAKDSHAVDAHYYLALAYLRHDESAGYARAIPEFEAELKINPNDVRSHYMLGYIALKQSRFTVAERELGQAAALQPSDLNTLVSLAEAFTGENRFGDAEATLRKAIAVAQNDSVQQRQSGRAHYLLGRLLMKTGREEDAKREMAISAEKEDTRGMSSGPAAEARAISSSSLAQQEARDRSDTPVDSSPDERKRVEEFKNQLSPVIGEGYNYLGAQAAAKQDYSTALRLFEQAAAWNPKLDGLDRNLGMAAFYSKEYAKVLPPLRRYLEGHPDDQLARSALEDAGKRQNAGK